MKKLPIAVQTFAEIRDGQHLYIDKTEHMHNMLQGSKANFLSRPRRFGKSLLLDTFKELFEGNRKLFQGLYIEDKWDWSQSYPVIKLDFADGTLQSREALDLRIRKMLQDCADQLGVSIPHSIHYSTQQQANDIPGCFRDLIVACHKKYAQKVVILIDEYDKPILDNIEQPEQAAQMREGLKNLYSVMKGQDAYIQFVFMTGVTKFSKVSLFSGINQIQDLTLHAKYATICGYTEQDLKTEFAGHLQGVDWEQLKEWYNGYQFSGQAVYNPYDILLFIDGDCRFKNYWFETGSPSFLLKLFKQRQYFLPDLEAIEVGEDILDSFDVERINPITLLFQAGYLTLNNCYETDFGELVYQLKVPNREVRSALNTHFIGAYAEIESAAMQWRQEIFRLLSTGDLARLQQQIKALFAGIPWRNFNQNDLPDSEGYYASVLYAFFASLNATIIPEDISCHGQADMTVILGDFIYVIEFKRDTSSEYQTQTPNPALEQIQSRQYSAKYLTANQAAEAGKHIFEVGMIFNTHARNLVQMDWVEVNA